MGAQIIDSGARVYDLGAEIIDSSAGIYDLGAQIIDPGAGIYDLAALAPKASGDQNFRFCRFHQGTETCMILQGGAQLDPSATGLITRGNHMIYRSGCRRGGGGPARPFGNQPDHAREPYDLFLGMPN